ncbi:rCG49010, partial [Rattus norvegicus]
MTLRNPGYNESLSKGLIPKTYIFPRSTRTYRSQGQATQRHCLSYFTVAEIFAKPKEVKPKMTKVPNCILCRLTYHLSPSLGRRFTATWSRVMGSDKGQGSNQGHRAGLGISTCSAPTPAQDPKGPQAPVKSP